MQFICIINLLILFLHPFFTTFVIEHLIIECELHTIIRALIGVCLSIDIIEVIQRSLSERVVIRVNLVRPWTNQASVQFSPIFFIYTLSSPFFLFLIDLLRLILFFVITFDQHIGGCLILIDGCDFEYYIFHLDYAFSNSEARQNILDKDKP